MTNTKPTQGLRKLWKYGWFKIKSTFSFDENKRKLAAINGERRYRLWKWMVSITWSMMRIFDSVMTKVEHIFDVDGLPKGWNTTDFDRTVNSYGFLYLFAVGPAMFLGWVWCLYLMPPLLLMNYFRRRKHKLLRRKAMTANG